MVFTLARVSRTKSRTVTGLLTDCLRRHATLQVELSQIVVFAHPGRAHFYPRAMTAVPIDLQARVQLAHAAVQALAEEHGVDLLHVKGPALHASLSRPDRVSSDADVLVRPTQVTAFTDHLRAHGWRLVTDFANGSAFEHAANYHHGHWGYVDVHRVFPGITVEPDAAFELLWSERIADPDRAPPVPGARTARPVADPVPARGPRDGWLPGRAGPGRGLVLR